MVWLDSGVLLDLAHGGNDSNFLEAALKAAQEQVSGTTEAPINLISPRDGIQFFPPPPLSHDAH